MTSYSTLIETMRLSCTVFELLVEINCRFWTSSVSGLRKLGTININKIVMVDFFKLKI